MSLYLVLALVVIVIVLIGLAIHYAQDAAKEKRKAAEEDLKSLERFHGEMAKPLAGGSSLVRAMRARARMRKQKRGGASGVSDSE